MRQPKSTSVSAAPAKPPPPAAAAAASPGAASLPIDILLLILGHLCRISPRCAVKALLISPELSPLVEADVYGTISLMSVAAMSSFETLVRRRPELGRRVTSLWIAPCRQSSDLITVLAPIPTGERSASEANQARVQAMAKSILRACRRLRHLALDGGFLTPQAAEAFGTPCKPTTLLCVNAHSFLGHFSAPIFRTVKRLEVVDTTLAVEEVDEIRQMPALRHFLWTSPRAQSDVSRDVSVLLRIVSPRALANTTTGTTAVAASEGDASAAATTPLRPHSQATALAPPEKTRINDRLTTICTSTSQARAASLASSFRKAISGTSTNTPLSSTAPTTMTTYSSYLAQHRQQRLENRPDYVDSGAAESDLVHVASGVQLQTRALHSLASIRVGKDKEVSTPASSSSNAATTLTASLRKLALTKGASSHTQHTKGQGNEALDQETEEEASEEQEGEEEQEEEEEEEEDDEVVVEEWEALRDVVCQRKNNPAPPTYQPRYTGQGGPTLYNHSSYGSSMWASDIISGESSANATNANSTRSNSPPVGATEIDGGRALERVWIRWRSQIESGYLDSCIA